MNWKNDWMDALIFSQIAVNRRRTIDLVSSLSEAFADIVPEGFNNNIRWNIGHIVATQERLAFRLIGETMDLDLSFMNLFAGGTKPADWQIKPPSMETLLELLEKQPERIQERLQGRLDEKLTIPFKEFASLDEALVFSIGHEALHAGYIMALKKAVAAAQ